MKIYLAGSWEDKSNMQSAMKKLIEKGHSITHDWTTAEKEYNDYHARSIRCSVLDIGGVCDADLVLALMTNDNYPYKGTRHEIGAAYALRELKNRKVINKAPLVWIVSNCDPRVDSKDTLPFCMQCCFEHNADDYFRSLDEALNRL